MATPDTARYVVLNPTRLLFASTSDAAIRAAKPVSAKYGVVHIVMLDKIKLTELKDYKGASGFSVTDSATSGGVVTIHASDNKQKLQKAKKQLDDSDHKPVPALTNNLVFAHNDKSSILYDKRNAMTHIILRNSFSKRAGKSVTGKLVTRHMFV